MANQGMTIHGISIQRITISNLVLMVIFSIVVFYAFGERPLDDRVPEAPLDDVQILEQPGPKQIQLDHIRLDQIGEGSLVFDDEKTGTWFKAPTVDTSVDMTITGMIASVSVTQTFSNPTTMWLNGTYIFPLPELAAVDQLKMIIGERVIDAQIKERQEARQIYQKAKSSGRKASLVEQERPNIFTNSVANIGPGEQIKVEIRYQQSLNYDQGSFSIRFPMVVAPRYIPGHSMVAGFDGSGWAINTDAVPDAQRITPIIETNSKQLADRNNNQVGINVNLHSGFELATLESSYHGIKKKTLPEFHYQIELDTGKVPANRDFELHWTPRLHESPQAALFTETLGEEQYGLLMLVPPHDEVDQSGLLSREMIFVIDTSGSMHGASLAQAKAAVVSALERLDADDLFNVVQFNSFTSVMSPHAIQATKASINLAKNYVYSLRANGGTEIRGALERVLVHRDAETTDKGNRLRQVIFLTDGSVGNENSLLALINEHLGNSRLFSIGIGSAPNSFFMREAATAGHGTFTYIGDVNEVQEKMSALLQKLESPVLSNININWARGQSRSGNPVTDFWPNPLRDLYLGEPLIVSIKIPKRYTDLHISGIRMGKDWSMNLPTNAGGTASGLNRLWARNKIRSLMNQKRKQSKSKLDHKKIRDEIVDLALKHHLVSKYTSLVAVDVTPTRPLNTSSSDAAMKVRLSQGWDHKQVFGKMPQTATPAQLQIYTGTMLLLVAALLLLFRAHLPGTNRRQNLRSLEQEC
jgi:Ca-activated chloride channel family protein